MIQRIQTLFLLVAAILCGITLFAPLAWFSTPSEMATLYAFTLQEGEQAVEQMPLWTGILLVLSTALPAVTIFLFHHRMLQIRLCAVEAVLLIGSLIMLGYTYFKLGAEVSSRGLLPAIGLPLIALVFVLLAARAIFRDEMLVKSLDRIR